MSLQIMVPLDGSPFSEDALAYAYELALHTNGVLHLVHVHPPVDQHTGDRILACYHCNEEYTDSEVKYLDRLAGEARTFGLRPIYALLHGPVIGALTNYAMGSGIDMVVMSTHGRGGLTRAWMGSVADELVRTLQLPVLLLRPGDDDDVRLNTAAFRRILIPVDGSEYSELMIDRVLQLVAGNDTQITLMQVAEPTPAVAFADGIPMPLSNDYEIGRREIVKHLAWLADQLERRGVEVSTVMTVESDVAEAIYTYAAEESIELIAMVTHGLSGWKRLALGSVSDRVIRGSHIPVLLLKPARDSVLAPLAS